MNFFAVSEINFHLKRIFSNGCLNGETRIHFKEGRYVINLTLKKIFAILSVHLKQLLHNWRLKLNHTQYFISTWSKRHMRALIFKKDSEGDSKHKLETTIVHTLKLNRLQSVDYKCRGFSNKSLYLWLFNTNHIFLMLL